MSDRGPPLLSSPVTGAAGRIVRTRLEAAITAAERLVDADDPDALHDFRVALRRLRSALRAYRPWLGRAASRKLRGVLRDLGRATNAGRDAEVQAAWLSSKERELPEQARGGAAKLAAWLGKHPSLHARDLQATFRITADKLLKRLDFPDDEGARFASVYTALLGEHAATAAARLAAVASAEQVEEAHEARIAVKRLRYLLEPLLDELPGAPALLAEVEALQDLLGELHDSHVLDETLAAASSSRRISRATLAALVAENAKRRDSVFAQLQGRWLAGTARSFFEKIRDLAGPA
jgi:CHAD domain-containing protein